MLVPDAPQVGKMSGSKNRVASLDLVWFSPFYDGLNFLVTDG